MFRTERVCRGSDSRGDHLVQCLCVYTLPSCLTEPRRNYAAVTADTFSSELGILNRSPPRLITSLSLRAVPPGTNGGVSLTGTLAGFVGGAIIGISSLVLLPFCNSGESYWDLAQRLQFAMAITVWGGMGSLVDSLLGGWLQASVVDRRTGKVVEGLGGKSVPYHDRDSAVKDKPESRYVVAGTEWLDNNGVNLLMAAMMSLGGMGIAWWVWA